MFARCCLFSVVVFSLGCGEAGVERGLSLPRGVGKADGIYSCRGSCGGQSPGGCWCDDKCQLEGDCCVDKLQQCDGEEPSCEGYCGKKSPFGCYCDSLCERNGDCCPGKRTACSGSVKLDMGVPDVEPASDVYPWVDSYTSFDAGVPGPDFGSCPVKEEEWCDGKDNDCDGVVDNGEVCPDASVQNGVAFTDGAYFLGTTAEGSCGADALQRFWPSLSVSYFSGFGCYADWYKFRKSDDKIFYYATFSGIVEDEKSGSEHVVSTPPCGDRVAHPFDFDGANTLYYRCGDTLRRGALGDLVAMQIKELVVVLDNGMSVVTRASQVASNRDAYLLLDTKGNVVSALDPHEDFVGELTAASKAATVKGNNAFVVYLRTYGQNNREIVVYRGDASGSWKRVRRVAVSGFGAEQLAISDGTVFVRGSDPLSYDEMIKAYPTSGPSQVVWREANATTVRAHIGDQMLTGPQ